MAHLGSEDPLALVRAEDLVGLTQTLLRIPSPDPPGLELRLAQHVLELLRSVGIPARMMPFARDRANLVARLAGQGRRPPLIFCAHLDTVPVGERPWAHPPYEGLVDHQRIYGRGAADMKGGMAAMILAMIALAGAGQEPAGDVYLALTAGEAATLGGARRLVQAEALPRGGALLVPGPTGLDVVIAQKAALWLQVITHGRGGHLACPALGSEDGDVNAIDRMIRFLSRLDSLVFEQAEHPLLGRPSFGFGTIRGGQAINLIPDHCEATLDLRLLPGQDPADISRELINLGGGEAEVICLDYKPAVETAPDHPFVLACQEARATELGSFSVPEGVSYFTDAAVLGPALDAPMVILGPGDIAVSGIADEWIDIERLLSAARIYTRIAWNADWSLA